MRVGLIGPGYWGRKILKGLADRPDIDNIVVVGRHDDLANILDNPDIQNVFIATPVPTHYDLCRSMLEAGKHVMCEKTLAPSAFATETLIQVAKAMDCRLFVDYVYALNPSLAQAREQIDGSDLVIRFLQQGVFREESVLSILGSHALAVTAVVADLKCARLFRREGFSTEDKHTGSLWYRLHSGQLLRIDLSLNNAEKIRTLTAANGHCWSLQYTGGIDEMIRRFLAGQENTDMVSAVARCMEQASTWQV
jgi:hypothetical protein